MGGVHKCPWARGCLGVQASPHPTPRPGRGADTKSQGAALKQEHLAGVEETSCGWRYYSRRDKKTESQSSQNARAEKDAVSEPSLSF